MKLALPCAPERDPTLGRRAPEERESGGEEPSPELSESQMPPLNREWKIYHGEESGPTLSAQEAPKKFGGL